MPVLDTVKGILGYKRKLTPDEEFAELGKQPLSEDEKRAVGRMNYAARTAQKGLYGPSSGGRSRRMRKSKRKTYRKKRSHKKRKQ